MSDGVGVVLMLMLVILGAYAGKVHGDKGSGADKSKEHDDDIKKLLNDLSAQSDADLIKSITSGSRDSKDKSDDAK